MIRTLRPRSLIGPEGSPGPWGSLRSKTEVCRLCVLWQSTWIDGYEENVMWQWFLITPHHGHVSPVLSRVDYVDTVHSTKQAYSRYIAHIRVSVGSERSRPTVLTIAWTYVSCSSGSHRCWHRQLLFLSIEQREGSWAKSSLLLQSGLCSVEDGLVHIVITYRK